MMEDRRTIEPGIIAIAGPTSSGKTTLANIIKDASLEFGVDVAPSTKYMDETNRNRPDDEFSRGQYVHVISPEEFDRRMRITGSSLSDENFDEAFGFTYTHDGARYAVALEDLDDSKAHIVPIILNHEGVTELMRVKGAHPDHMGIVRRVLLHVTETDITKRLQIRKQPKESIDKRIEQFRRETDIYVQLLSEYPIIFATDLPFEHYTDDQDYVAFKRQEAISLTFNRLLSALRNGIVNMADNTSYIERLVQKITGSDINGILGDAGWNGRKGKGYRLDFDRDDIRAFSEQSGMREDAIKGILPTYVIGAIQSNGILSLLFNSGKDHERYDDSYIRLIQFFKHALGMPQYESRTHDPEYSRFASQGMYRIDNHAVVAPLASWGFRDIPQGFRKDDQTVDRLFLSVAKDHDPAKTHILTLSEQDKDTAYRRAMANREPIF